jgi:hypothetical protein
MSLYEGLSLVLSTVGTMFTVYLGFRQLRQAAPAAMPAALPDTAAPTAGSVGAPPGLGSYTAQPTHRPGPEHRRLPASGAGAGSAPYGVGRMPAPPYGRAPTPTPVSPPAPVRYPTSGAPQAYGAPPAYRAPHPPVRGRPTSVRAASILLFVAAALQPVVLFARYVIVYATNTGTASGVHFNIATVTFLGVVAILCGILGILLARGSRVAAWCVWVFGLVGVPFAAVALYRVLPNLAILANPPPAFATPGETLRARLWVIIVVAYLVVVSLAIAASGILLINSKARAFFFRKA